MTTDVKSSRDIVALSKVPVPIPQLSAKRSQMKKRLMACKEKVIASCWDLTDILNETHEALSPYKGEWLSLVGECGISRSQAYAAIKAFRRAQEIPPETLKNFSGPTALMRLTSKQSLSDAIERASNGEFITVEKANEISATCSSKASCKSMAIKVTASNATIVIHPRRGALGIAELQKAIELAVHRCESKEGVG